jgi:hypothetical protein
VTARDPLAIECPKCGSRPGIPCCYHPYGGRQTKFYTEREGYHAARTRAAEREKEGDHGK